MKYEHQMQLVKLYLFKQNKLYNLVKSNKHFGTISIGNTITLCNIKIQIKFNSFNFLLYDNLLFFN